MERKIASSFLLIIFMLMILFGPVQAAEDAVSPGTQTSSQALNEQGSSQSLGAQAGETAKELKDKAEVASVKVAEASKKVEAEAQDLFKDLQKQWDEFAKRFQASLQQLSVQMKQQEEDFKKSFNKPPKS